MRDDIAISLLSSVIKDVAEEEELAEFIRYFQTMAKYKYDDYQQYTTGQRFVETLARWLSSFSTEDKKVVLKFLKSRLIFISSAEMNLLAESCFPDALRKILSDHVAEFLKSPKYMLSQIMGNDQYKILLRQSLFCGLSDGAKLDIFRRANTGTLSHEQIYLTYELSISRIKTMRTKLENDLQKSNYLGRTPTADESKFKLLFLIDDFSASGTSYLKYKEQTGELKGKIADLYKSLFPLKNGDAEDKDGRPNVMRECFHDNLKIYIILYLCTSQAKKMITGNFHHLSEKYGHEPELIIIHEIDDAYKITAKEDIYQVCQKDSYYDKALIEDEHIQGNAKMGFGDCALPVVLAHNTPNNSVPLLWSYEYSQIFRGLFPRIPRHRVL